MIAYHSALELHGYAYSQGYDVQVIAPGEPRVFEADGPTCRFVKPPRGFAGPSAPETDGVTSVDRLGMEVRVTTLARTVADLFDRHDLAGGAEELFNSIDLVTRVDSGALEKVLRLLELLDDARVGSRRRTRKIAAAFGVKMERSARDSDFGFSPTARSM